MRIYFACFSIIAVAFYISILHGQPLYTAVIGTSELSDATGYSNGFKIAYTRTEFPEEHLCVVYAYNDTLCYYGVTTDRGVYWDIAPIMRPGPGWNGEKHPSVDMTADGMMVFFVYESESSNVSQVFLECPYDYCIPQRLSFTEGNSIMPAIVIDDGAGVHVVWQDDTHGLYEIYYCFCPGGCMPGDTINISQSSMTHDRYPSISIFNDGDIYVIWERYDEPCETPYSIVSRCLHESEWSDEVILDMHWEPRLHPSFDYCHGEDSISAAWEQDNDALFYGGNGGGFSTDGESQYPVVSTVSATYSYLYWQDNSEGYADIYANIFYGACYPEWWDYRFRDYYYEDVGYPNTAGCYVVWTQGDSAPYDVMFACEGYPTGINENIQKPAQLSIKCSPNPFNSSCRITVDVGDACMRPAMVELYDLRGNAIWQANLSDNKERTQRAAKCNGQGEALWIPDETISSGIYFVRATAHDGKSENKRIVYLR